MLIDIVYFWGMAIRFNVSIQKLGHEMVATYNHLIIHKQDDSKIENQDITERSTLLYLDKNLAIK